MKYVAAYLLATLGGKSSPSAADVTAILKAAGADVDTEKLNTLLKSMEGKVRVVSFRPLPPQARTCSGAIWPPVKSMHCCQSERKRERVSVSASDWLAVCSVWFFLSSPTPGRLDGAVCVRTNGLEHAVPRLCVGGWWWKGRHALSFCFDQWSDVNSPIPRV